MSEPKPKRTRAEEIDQALLLTPMQLPSPSAAQLTRRIAVALGSLSRHMAVARRRGPLDRQSVAVAVRKTFDDLGGTFTKFGQLIASSPGLFGDDVADEFRGCLDSGPPVPFRQLRQAIEKDLGNPIGEIFAHIERKPLAAASLAVVHKATLVDGREVAVKILRPGIKRSLATDLATLRPIADFVGRQVAVGVAGTLPALIRGLGAQLAEEVDLANEAQCIRWFRALLDGIGAQMIKVPEPVDELCGNRTLVMELIEGVPIDDDEGIAAMGVDPRPALRECLRAWFAGLLCLGAFHGDIHAGNLLICPDGKMAVLDWGIVGRVDEDTALFLRRLLEGSLGDDSAWTDVARYIEKQYGGGLAKTLGLDEASWTAWVRAYLEPMFNKPIGEVDLQAMIMGPEGGPQVERERNTKRDQLAYWWEERRRMRALMASDGFDGGFDRATFLLGKQLVYFERYGKKYLPEVPLIDDREAYRALLDLLGPATGEGIMVSSLKLEAAAALIRPLPGDDDGTLQEAVPS
ncbi:MAG TPA: AarF/ABC1/UbiB kinase family protein [Acidimicrobiales bacterium]|nr:AarF/ABC1/UbiB kinase family protein [Acidimicrobiales bacterium]